jgi:hypothetical protein
MLQKGIGIYIFDRDWNLLLVKKRSERPYTKDPVTGELLWLVPGTLYSKKKRRPRSNEGAIKMLRLDIKLTNEWVERVKYVGNWLHIEPGQAGFLFDNWIVILEEYNKEDIEEMANSARQDKRNNIEDAKMFPLLDLPRELAPLTAGFLRTLLFHKPGIIPPRSVNVERFGGLIGDESKKYLVYKEAWGGSYGEVYQVLDIPSLSARAIKAAIPNSRDKNWRDRFISEGSTLISLLSKNFDEEVEKVYSINKVHDGKQDNKYFLVKNWVKGETLQSRFEGNGHRKITDRLVIDIMKSLITTLQKLRSLPHPVYHRDLKPNNIMISFSHSKLYVTIIDFGLCKREHQEIGTSPEHHTGNPIYQSYNIVRNWYKPEPLDDFYSVLQVHYWLLFGTDPYVGLNREAIEEMKKKGRDSFLEKRPEDFQVSEKFEKSIQLFREFYRIVKKYFSISSKKKRLENANQIVTQIGLLLQ